MNDQHRTGEATNDDIKVTRHGDGAAVQLWGSHLVLGRDDAFDLLNKLRTVLARVAAESNSEEQGEKR